jgi:hypothetical protein
MTKKPSEFLTQHQLAQTLRFRIDRAKDLPAGDRYDREIQIIRMEIADSPRGFASSHVRHNLGAGRLAWLKEKGIE